jgi:hypothetical protein
MLDHRERERQSNGCASVPRLRSSEYPGSVNLNDGGRPELTLPKGHFLGVAFTMNRA